MKTLAIFFFCLMPTLLFAQPACDTNPLIELNSPFQTWGHELANRDRFNKEVSRRSWIDHKLTIPPGILRSFKFYFHQDFQGVFDVKLQIWSGLSPTGYEFKLEFEYEAKVTKPSTNIAVINEVAAFNFSIPNNAKIGWTLIDDQEAISYSFCDNYNLLFRQIRDGQDPLPGNSYEFAGFPFPGMYSIAVELDTRLYGGRGPPGLNGATGPKGGRGEKGEQGAQGEAGARGDAGQQGERGPRGDTGDVGPPGAKGDRGDDGAPGRDGASGSPGSTGLPGPEGPIGPGGGDTGPPGSEGPVGPIGATGPRGLNGINGAAGPKGDRGDNGVKGDKGDSGSPGSTGLPGPEGPIGPGGGDTGPPGSTGLPGSEGPVGPIGATGPRGLNGINGAAGPKGDRGDNGVKGDKGDKGDSGNQGDTGFSGPKGDRGDNGLNGLNGERGARGPTGPQGPIGPPGPGGGGNDVDECQTNAHSCVAPAKCSNTVGSYVCQCEDGYSLSPDGKSCRNRIECDTNNGGCEHICSDNEGSYKCSCKGGYSLSDNSHSCHDINECGGTENPCAIGGCVNTPGSFVCVNVQLKKDPLVSVDENSKSRQTSIPTVYTAWTSILTVVLFIAIAISCKRWRLDYCRSSKESSNEMDNLDNISIPSIGPSISSMKL